MTQISLRSTGCHTLDYLIQLRPLQNVTMFQRLRQLESPYLKTKLVGHRLTTWKVQMTRLKGSRKALVTLDGFSFYTDQLAL